MNVYIKSNDDWTHNVKYGFVNGDETNLVNRINDSREEHPEISTFIHIFVFKKTNDYKLKYTEIDKIISHVVYNKERISEMEIIYDKPMHKLYELHPYLVQSRTKKSTEFIQKKGLECLLQVLREIFPSLGLNLVKEYSVEDLQRINESVRASAGEHDNDLVGEPVSELVCESVSESVMYDVSTQDDNIAVKWFEREYQTTIIEYANNELSLHHKLYLELATGGGKTYIVYNILSHLKPDVIIILSPRMNINKQNCNSKYISILKDAYSVYNCSEDKHFDSFEYQCRMEHKKMLIVGCPQSSYKKIYDMIQNKQSICIWFDEAHHTIENWTNKIDNEYIKFFLESDTIANRIFTSASPDKKHIEQYPHYFGEIYSPIKVKELIDMKWLCPIIPHSYSSYRDNVDICNYNIEHFEKYDCNFGFSFHNLRDSAYELFIEHYQKYKGNHTTIKPYLLVGDDYQISETIDYDFRSIQEFENNRFSIGYVVQQYSMGYDFNQLDFIVFSDPKMTYSDIVQCIGRGIRPDGLGINGQNLKKRLTILLPIYIDIEIDTYFNRIEGVLRYLVYDIDYPFDKIVYDFKESKGDKEKLANKYGGEESIKAILLDLLRGGKYSSWKECDFIRLLKNHHIHTMEDYKKFERKELNLPEEPYRCFPEFTWEQTYNESPYYSKEQCIKKILELKEIHHFVDLEDEHYEPELYLNLLDPNIPPLCLFRFYGGHNNKEFY